MVVIYIEKTLLPKRNSKAFDNIRKVKLNSKKNKEN